MIIFILVVYNLLFLFLLIRFRKRKRILEEANTLLKENDRIKSEYVLRVSHDIKEHLAAISACLDPVMAGITGELNAQQSDLIHRAVSRTAKLMFFVKALLEITRIKLGKGLKMDYFSFKDTLAEAVNQIISKARDKNISVSSTVEPGVDRIYGAREYIQETISNLLANSVKYTPRDGMIDVSVSDKGSSILIEIKDAGIGIPRDELPRIFEEFYRASNAKEAERDGTGLGLSIAKQIVERHNGRIWVESQEGKGSKFSIELPK